MVIVLSPNISNDLGGEGSTHGFSDSKKLTRTLVDATVLKTNRKTIVLVARRLTTKSIILCVMMFDLFASLIITPGVRASLQMTSGGNAKINMI